MSNDVSIIYPILVAAFLTAFGWLLRQSWQSIEDKIDDLEASFTRITSDLVAQHHALEQRIGVNSERIEAIDKRIVRIESWKELFTMPDLHGRQRRITDRFQAADDEGEE